MLVQANFLNFSRGIYYFGYEEARLWNSLEPQFKHRDRLSYFKVSLQTWKAGYCKCGVYFLYSTAR